VTAEPDVFEDLLSPHDQFLLLACDGLWDVFSNQEAVDFVRAALPHYRPEEVPPAGSGTAETAPC
jgi:serine/threonine protein phosphatase PrpC